MVFSSIPFLYYFFPMVLVLYFVAPKPLKNIVLLLTSLLFYGWGEPKYLFLMLAVIAVCYVLGLLMGVVKKQSAKKACLIASVVINIGVLMYFKYADFFIDSFNSVTGMNIKLLKLALPIGISFYIFQSMSYLIDVYRGEVAVQKNPITLATYVTLFPQLIAGPIVRYSDICDGLASRTHTIDKVSEGIRRFVLGLGKKALIANNLGVLCNAFYNSSDKSVLFFWLYAIGYTLQIYFDFSGYSDMAIGIGKIFGFDFLENFNYPYISKSITEFWRRWHMSLGSWFRDYVYIPLGGNKCSKGRHFFNILVVWMLTGFWHGASWNFVLWGLFYAALLMLEKAFLLKYLKKSRVFGRVYVLLAIIIGFVIFDATSVASIGSCLAGMFGFGGYSLTSVEALYYLKSFAFTLLIAGIGATPLPKWICRKISEKKSVQGILYVLEPVFLCAIILVVTAYLVDGSFNPFLYFRF